MNPPIQSTRHPLIQNVHALAQKKSRDESGQILVETKHPIEEALKAGLTPVHYFYLADAKDKCPVWPNDAIAHEVSEAVMKKLSTTDSIPPCIAVFKKPELSLEAIDANAGKAPFYLVAERMQDPGNLGTLIRTAAAFQCDGILLTQNSVEACSPKVIRASAGLVFHMPVYQLSKSLEECFALPIFSDAQWLFSTGHDVWQGLSTQHYKSINYIKPTLLVLGNEGQGLGEILALPESAQAIRIPTNPDVESLNVSISAAIILAEAYHQKSA